MAQEKLRIKTIAPPGKVFLMLGLALLVACGPGGEDQWSEDFRHQPLATRPDLEVNYTDGERTAFQILAEDYHWTGQLRTPHLLTDDQGKELLWMEFTDEEGRIYSTRNFTGSSRINLYRRGPYFCEIHWFDMQPAGEGGEPVPLKGDLTLFCYPEKVLAEVAWHGTGDFLAQKLEVKGIAPQSLSCESFSEGVKQVFRFPLFGEEDPLPDEAFTLIEGEVPLKYNARKGYYEVGTITSSSFQEQFYDFPNRYETATFRIRNDDTPRKIYIGHKSVAGGGIVEGGVVLDAEGHPMPLLVQVSKNFDGEKEEKFYNPLDTAFSETYFPLYLEAGESMTLSSLHLYQNWGRHMTKHWSSLGAWMDYFHSSTGVTETTCYVPFKFAGIGGVAIADFRAMSQEAFWKGQPQHDNLAGHSFLSFHDGEQWQHSKYESTDYRSTGPNWYDIQMNYTSADGSVGISADIWETPQVDELRSFFKVRYEVLKPLVIEDATERFRFLTVTSAIQRLRFTRVAASGLEPQEIDFSKSMPLKGHPLPGENAFLAVYGDHTRERGSNAIIIRSFSGPDGIGPAASLQAGPYLERFEGDQEGDTRLFLAPDTDRLELEPGDVFEIDGYWLPYGPLDQVKTPEKETVLYANDRPKVLSCKKGTVLEELPVWIRADNNRAEFTLEGGRDLLPVMVTGLTDWKYPRIWKKEGKNWRLLSHARNSAHDGYQVFCAEDGSYGAAFLVHSDEKPVHLKVSAGRNTREEARLTLEKDGSRITTGEGIRLSYPMASEGQEIRWKESEGNSLWFESREEGWLRGGRINPNQDDLDLEYWWQNSREGVVHDPPRFIMETAGTAFEDPEGERTWILTGGEWKQAQGKGVSETSGTAAIALADAAGERFLCMAWPRSARIHYGQSSPGIAIDPVEFSMGHRYHIRGKIFIVEGSLEVLKDRIDKEITTR